MFSSSNPPPLPAASPEHPSEPPLWTLDDLFLLPKGRLRYYRKLYSRLLKSTTPGRSDHRLLTTALEKLDALVSTLDERSRVKVWGEGPPPSPHAAEPEEVVIDFREEEQSLPSTPAIHRDSGSTGTDSRSM